MGTARLATHMEESPATYYGTVAGTVVGLTLLVASQGLHDAMWLLYPGGAVLLASIFAMAHLVAQGETAESAH